ncbi:hypothetical protein FOV72_20590 [Gordonia rubripertincta]|uniref:hypothetical protein n=1 Tax=Gordonia rubripertincta TaxID=36822 RepID=UPI001180C75C|nr:hypothetical protein [Gordonia rubripertincta]TSD93232.1 hypothetical protein FOV72_20590 [Gordonia rubripertincta]
MSAEVGNAHIGLVVEGRGDAGALPVVLRKFLYEQEVYGDILGKPIVANGISNALRNNGIEGFVSVAAGRPGCKAVLVVLDSDDECVVERGQVLLERSGAICAVPVVIALADRTFEDWIYASAETLELNLDFEASRRGMSEISSSVKKVSGGAYVKPTWQPRLAHRMDLDLAAGRSSSLKRLLDRFDQIRNSVGIG